MRFVPARASKLLFIVALQVVVALSCTIVLPDELVQLKPTPIPTLVLPTAAPTVPPPSPTPAPSVAQVEWLESLSPAEIDQLLASFLPADNQVPAKYAVHIYQIRFQTLDENDRLIEARANLYFPRVETPTVFPVFVYGSGTTGIGHDCATLDERFPERNWGNYRSHMLSYAAQGFITILPNWQGFDDPNRTHPYFVAELEGRVMLDAARAVYSFFEHPPETILAQPAPAVFLGGYSQGGHGAFAADHLASDYAPELPIKGIIGHATSPDVEGLMYDSPRYSPYVVYAFRAFYGGEVVNPEDVFLPNWLTTFESDVTSKCIDEVLRHYSDNPAQMYTPEFLDALYNDRLAETFPAFKDKLDANNNRQTVDTAVPAIILHGEADPIVKPQTNQRFVIQMCNKGKNVIYYRYPDVNHFDTRQHGFVDTLAWMQSVLDGNTPVSGCSDFFTSFFK